MSGKSGLPPPAQLTELAQGVEVAAGAEQFDQGHGTAGRRPESLARAERLRRRADYLRCYRTGRRRTGSLVMFYVAANEAGCARMGITATRKVGNAVRRHRLKRWIRETYRRWPGKGRLAALDIVVHLKPEAGAASHASLAAEVGRLLADLVRRGEVGARRDPRDARA